MINSAIRASSSSTGSRPSKSSGSTSLTCSMHAVPDDWTARRLLTGHRSRHRYLRATPAMPYTIIFTERYTPHRLALPEAPPDMARAYEKTLALLQVNPHHPSLRLHELGGKPQGAHSISINMSHRITLHVLVQSAPRSAQRGRSCCGVLTSKRPHPSTKPPHVRLHRVIDCTLLDGLRLSLENRIPFSHRRMRLPTSTRPIFRNVLMQPPLDRFIVHAGAGNIQARVQVRDQTLSLGRV